MKLTKFKVTNFRSAIDSGWIEVDGVTALIGVNESGKTNLLLPLWKLNPARDGEIQPTSDYPKAMFGDIRAQPGNYDFIIAEFETGNSAMELARVAGISVEEATNVRITRGYADQFLVEFPNYHQQTSVETASIGVLLTETIEKLENADALKQETELKEALIEGLSNAKQSLPDVDVLSAQQLKSTRNDVSKLLPAEPAKTSVIVPIVKQIVDKLASMIATIEAPAPGAREGVIDAALAAIPKFVYYSNYGNLDSEIYLPHVVENLKREDLGAKEAAKARTLRVLFQFVGLEPQEILELGRDFIDSSNPTREPTDEEVAEIAEKKRERSILLQSASTKLTQKFKEWWKQGDYRFRFEADGNHFRIWVSDDRRPQEIELENRSTGLQWFLSFYIVFLVESIGEHKKAMLLLDEPGMSLHPLAQRDLSAFFENLSKTNQLIYTSHSPFLVDADRLERARKVYVADDGSTRATPDLRHSEGGDTQEGAAYAVHSALNLSVAESLLIGCQPVIVEGASDQFYLTTIKALLISGKNIAPTRELVFPPSGGTKTARVVASILTGRDEKLPVMLLDADGPGKRMAKELSNGLYADAKEKVISVGDFVEFDEAEIEDLFPPKFLADEMDRMEREPETRLADVIKDGGPFVGQVETWAEDQGVTLQKHWKVELAKRAKQRALAVGLEGFDVGTVDDWVKLFTAFAEKDG
jgi:AAA ATPase-like protein